MSKTLSTTLKSIAAVLVAIYMIHILTAGNPAQPVAPVMPGTVSEAQVHLEAKQTPAPTTVAGYQKMFDAVSPYLWGAADVTLSVPMPDGRVVWLFGDTGSKRNGFVHSTAMVQTGGTLHVSHKGEQLLPNDKPYWKNYQSIYWIEDARAINNDRIAITAGPVAVSDKAWDFHARAMVSRLAIAKVDDRGNVTFLRWKKWTDMSIPFGDLSSPEPGHLTYERRAHPEAKLSSGLTLMSVNNSWTTEQTLPNGDHDYRAYRATFFAGDGVEGRLSGQRLEAARQWRKDHMMADPNIPANQ